MVPCRHGSAVGLYPNIDTVQIFIAVEYLANDGENIIVGFELFLKILESFFFNGLYWIFFEKYVF
jgi:hypothetical protein